MSKKSRVRNYSNWGPTSPEAKRSLSEKPEADVSGGGHFATRERANDFIRLMRKLPDPDPILRNMGRGITALQELLADSHLESVWSIRCSTVSGAEWFMAAGADGPREQEAADAFAKELSAMDVPRIIEEMMEAVAYGYAPLEVLWRAEGKRWGIANLVGKPPQWFEFDTDNHLVFRTGVTSTEAVAENRFLLVRHRPRYANPYGDKVFSKCFWPVTFKKNGFRWWTVFVEKYGGAFLYGKYPTNAGEEYKAELLQALEKMVSDAVAIAPEGAEITIEALANKGSVSNVHAEYIAMANSEISKAVLGQTLTTEIGSSGSYAAAHAHNLVRADLAAADRRRIASAFTHLAAVYTFYNFGSDVQPPVFSFLKDEDLQTERVGRDEKLYHLGWRPKASYIAREYGIPLEDFDVVDATTAQGFSRKQRLLQTAKNRGKAGSAFGCASENTHLRKGKKRQGFFSRIAALFASKTKQERDKKLKLSQEFETSLLASAQAETDATLDTLLEAIEKAENFLAAYDYVSAAASELVSDEYAGQVEDVRYVASQLGASGE